MTGSGFVQVVVAVLHRQDQVVLVGESRDRDAWTAPGGGVERGETLTEALVREVAEETGLKLTEPPRLAFVVNTTSAAYPSAVAFFFDCPAWTGELTAQADPDNDISQVAELPLAGAIARLRTSTAGRAETEPVLAHLSGHTQPLWEYRDGIPTRRR